MATIAAYRDHTFFTSTSLILAGLFLVACSSQAVDDSTVTAKVKTKLATDSQTSAIKIGVDTTGGVVTLSGTVPTPEDISKAMLLAMETDGVTEVVSTLQVKPPPPKKG